MKPPPLSRLAAAARLASRHRLSIRLRPSSRVPTGTTGRCQLKVRQTTNPYTLFETLQVRPLALSSDGELLFAANTPDNRLEIFPAYVGTGFEKLQGYGRGRARADVDRGPIRRRSVGGQSPLRLRQHRGRQRPLERRASIARSSSATSRATSSSPASTTIARSSPRPTAGRTLPTIPICSRRASAAPTSGCSTRRTSARPPGEGALAKLTFFADTPRALAATPDGKTVYAAAFFSGGPDHDRAPRGPQSRRCTRTECPARRPSRSAGKSSPSRPRDSSLKYRPGPDQGSSTGSTPTARSSTRS